MRRHKQTIPDTGHCLTLAEMSEGYGQAGLTAAERAERVAIERAREDGTEHHFRRVKGPRDIYADDLPDPISDASPVHCLAYYGLGVREIELLERHLCLTIGDVRAAIANCDIIAWGGGTRTTENVIREAVEGIPG